VSGAGFGDFMGLLSGIKIHTSPYAYLDEAVRKHKHRSNQRASYHRRIQKKWLKRFGTKRVPCAFMVNGSILGMGFDGMIVPPEMAKSLVLLKDISA
jgi:hypothetical protein